MRLSLRFIIPLLLVLACVAYAVVPLVDSLTVRWFTRDLDIRAQLVATTVEDAVQDLLRANNQARVRQLFSKITQDERLFAMAFCASPTAKPLGTPSLPPELTCGQLQKYTTSDPSKHLLASPRGPLLVSVRPLAGAGPEGGDLVLVHDMSFAGRRSEETRKYLFYVFAGLALTISLITVVVAQLSWRGWEQGLRSLMRGEGLLRPTGKGDNPQLRPIARDLRALIQDIQSEHRSREDDQVPWGPDALRAILDGDLRGHEVIVVSNREPYLHMYQDDEIVVRQPASGLVTALEPIMRATSGVWVAHGSGTADHEVVDRHDRVGVPVDNPAYQIRRVWLTAQEESGYYYGFSNEGLWPLCHNAHVRPTFRATDWDQYVAVNRKFAEAVVAEATSNDPIVLVQDYHFALLPRMVRDMLPNATIITFWHIPWPNPEAFSICPWREELLNGLLGSSILGFHTQFHCNNFLDTVDRLLEARVERESFTVSFQGEATAVKRYPISVDWPPAPALMSKPVEHCRRDVRRHHHLPDAHVIGVGVDRLDYTKGIEERLRSVQRFLELHPEWVGRFSFVQIAAPTRSSIEHYQAYEARVRALAMRINTQFSAAAHPPIILHAEHHEPREVYEYYRASELCFVSSLHDGMNLVAKEFIAARDDERGVLVLSQFAGAAKELPESIIVNPYDVEQCAEALFQAVTMPQQEQRARMRLMRSLVGEFNVYRWAGRMMLDAANVRRRSRLLQRFEFSMPLGNRRPSVTPKRVVTQP
ncbi:MAG TPA: trehalose-6-phosphate synthase [Gemmatimonadaceae bacterium]|nr:trehalose-6-phosphate synthase [Gemmatimonadaceae bacterium]